MENIQDLINQEQQQVPQIEILQKTIDELLAKRNDDNQAIFEKIDKDNKLLEDYILLLGKNSNVKFMANGQMYMNFDVSTDDETTFETFKFHDHALLQLSDKFDIPRKYTKYLNSSEWGRQLLKKVFEEHMQNCGRKRLLVRTVGNQIRGILSDKYKRLNSNQIYEAFIKGAKENQAVIYEAYYSETKTYISAIIPKVFEVQTINNGTVYTVFGVRISNSDFGNGALNVRAFKINVMCLNGMVTQALFNQVHLGKQLPENINFSDKTYLLDTETMASAVYDVMKDILSQDRILETVNAIKQASMDVIDIKKEVVKLPKTYNITKDEVASIEEKLMNNDPNDGVQGLPTRWKLTQALTSVGNEIGGERKFDFEEIAGKIAKL